MGLHIDIIRRSSVFLNSLCYASRKQISISSTSCDSRGYFSKKHVSHFMTLQVFVRMWNEKKCKAKHLLAIPALLT